MRLIPSCLLVAALLAASPLRAQADDPFFSGVDRLDAGDSAGALRLFDEALRASPGDYVLQAYRARALVNLDRLDEAASAAEAFAAGATAPERPEYEELLGLIEAARRAQAESPAEEAARQLGLAERELLAEEWEQAAASAASALRLDPSMHTSMVVRALALEGLGNLDDAAGLLRAYRDLRGTLSRDPRADDALKRIDASLAAAESAPEDEHAEAAAVPAAGGPAGPAGPPAPGVRREAFVVGVLGGYSLTAGDLSPRDWSTVQLRLDIPIASTGLGLHVQIGLTTQVRDGFGYGHVPIELGAVWRIGRHAVVVPYLDAYVLLRYADDTFSASGQPIAGAVPAFVGGAGGGGGVEFDLVPAGSVSLRLAPELHLGAAGAFLLHAGVGLRFAIRRPGRAQRARRQGL